MASCGLLTWGGLVYAGSLCEDDGTGGGCGFLPWAGVAYGGSLCEPIDGCGLMALGGLIYAGSLCVIEEVEFSDFVSGCAGNLAYGGTVYEGWVCTDGGAATGVTPVPSNVLNIDDFQGRLGCGVPSFFITRRCASSGVECVLDDYVVSANWSRELDEVSEAEVKCNFSGTTDFTCCECLAETEPWCSELHIWRDGVEVWVGPIIQLEYTYDTVTIKANDSLGWLAVRIPPGNIDYTDIPPGIGPADLADIAENVLIVAFAEDSPEFTCEIDNLFKVDTGEVTQRFFEGFNETALDILSDIAEAGLNFTTLGRTIVLTGDDAPLTPLILLNDEHIMGDIKITKDGTSQGNRYYIHFDDDDGIPAIAEAADFYCYTAIERIRDGDGLTDQATAEDLAEIYVNASGIAPRTVDIGSGSRLSPDTPWTINQMVCGARVDVAVTRLCLNLTQSFILTGVQVSYDAGGGEEVGITLTPINNVEVAG